MGEDGSVLYSRDADSRRLIASTTKLMTALVCLENDVLDDTVVAQARHAAVEGSSMYLRAGERYTVRELLLGLLLSSGNDAALALAEHTAGSEAAFVGLMNRRAQELGLKNTRFENPHGLDGADHRSTAHDLAALMLYCMENPAFRELTKLRTAPVKEQTLVNHNKLLAACPGCVGGKTGYTRAAGRCLVSCCERDGMRLVCVTLNDPDDWNDHRRLYDWAFDNYSLHELSEELRFEVPVITGNRTSVTAAPAPGTRLILPRNAETEVHAELSCFVFAPVRAGAEAGMLSILKDGKTLVRYPLIYMQGAELADPCFSIVS